MKSILLTGATGFISSYLIPLLIHHCLFVHAAIRNHSSKLPSQVTPVTIGDLKKTINWHQALNGIDTVIHLAAQAHVFGLKTPDTEAEFFKINAEATANLVKQAIEAEVKHFIFISSIGAMASVSNRILIETSPCQPDTPYGRSKLAAEQALINLASQSDMAWTILRPTLVYGPGNPGNMERLIKLVKKGLPLPFEQVNNSRSLVYVGNLVDAIITCLTHPNAKNQTFLISDGEDLSTPDLIRKIAYYLDCPCNLLPVPPSLLRVAGHLGNIGENVLRRSLPLNTPTIDRLLGSLVVDSSKIRNTLNWQPPFTMDEGLQQTLRP